MNSRNFRGSQWRRWDPHIHAPGTILNNQFKGNDPWEDYLSRLENSVPKIEAIGITDYYVTETYERILKCKSDGRLSDVDLIFPNVELRLDIAAKSGFVNLHLLVSPEDSDHLVELHRILNRLQFQAHGDTYNCTRDDLIKLGKRADSAIVDDMPALAHGATQFKVNFTNLKQVYNQSDWAKANILIAVAGGASDGTGGIRQASDQTVRQEIEKFAHVIFSSSPAQREFWCGKRSLSIEQLKQTYGGCKPCLHGCDAHKAETVGNPDDDRYSWIKGGIEFDALRQACIDPEGRTYVGSESPLSAMPSQVIDKVTISNADWANTPEIHLNPGLVAIIGARGSGKTALADIIAAGCEAISQKAWGSDGTISSSFLSRAKNSIGDATVTLQWGGEATLTRFLDGRDSGGSTSFPRVRYLSQQFVEELCSSTGLSDGLIQEMERIVFESNSIEDREGAADFVQLREKRTVRCQNARKRGVDAIVDISNRIATEIEKGSLISNLTVQITQKEQQINGYTADLAKLVVRGSANEAARYSAISAAVQAANSQIQSLYNQKRTFIALQDEVASTRLSKTPEILRQTKERHTQSGMTQDQWSAFLLDYTGTVDDDLEGYIQCVNGQIGNKTGISITVADPNIAVISDDEDLSSLPLNTLQAEMTRLGNLISADQLIRNQYTALTQRIAQENSALETIKARLQDSEGAAGRRHELSIERNTTYGKIFQAIIDEQNVLVDLYSPLMNRLNQSSGTLKKLGFVVKRVVDVNAWGSIAERDLLDRRKTGDFQGIGSFIRLANDELKTVWETGSAIEVQEAMSNFASAYSGKLMAHAPFPRERQTEYRNWLKHFAHWLFSTDHIHVRYEILYDGMDIRKLSPGTRGIVLLLLYLALDDADDRPLIIDQPEENLDPRSVYNELVNLFIDAKKKRQVIIVTHNANLVVNTDADQIIIADAGLHNGNNLPQISYRSGGLDNAEIRTLVCDILEGGDVAFKERARRLRVRLER